MPRSIVTFLLVASFGILLVGCTPPEPEKSFEEFTFSEDDLIRTQELIDESASGSETSVPSLVSSGSQLSSTSIVLNFAKQKEYDRLRSGVQGGENIYRVTNDFLNVRQGTSVSTPLVAKLLEGDSMTLLEIPNAGWAKIRLSDGKEGYVALRYIAKVTTDAKLAEEKKQFDGKYFVDFQFLNIRKDPNQQAEKIGELPGQSIVKPLSINDQWARITFEGKEGYVSSQYLRPFAPSFLVRQDEYKLPILRYAATDGGSMNAMKAHIAALKQAGKKIVTLKYLYDLVQTQENRDARVDPNAVALTISGVTPATVKEVSDALSGLGVAATLFVAGKDVGLSGITEKTMLTLLANGNDIQAAGHTGDDLRSLTDSQVELELSQSKKLIEDLSHREVYALFYPQGGVNDRVMRKAAETGYLFGIADIPDTHFTRSQFLRIPGILIPSSMTSDEVQRLVNPK